MKRTQLELLLGKVGAGEALSIVPYGPSRVDVLIGRQTVMAGDRAVILESLVGTHEIDDPHTLPLPNFPLVTE